MALKKSDIAKFKKRLEEMHSQLTQSLKGSTAEVKKPDEATGYSQHQADQGTDDFDRTISLEVTSREYGILHFFVRNLFAAEPIGAAAGKDQAVDQLKERRLAAAVRSEQGNGFALFDAEADIPKRIRFRIRIFVGNILDFNHFVKPFPNR